MKHRGAVKYAEVMLRDVKLPKGWRLRRIGDIYEAHGLCPECLGDSYGPAIAEPGLLALELRKVRQSELVYVDRDSDPVHEIVASCICGYEHGQDGAKGCGRYWVVCFIPEERK